MISNIKSKEKIRTFVIEVALYCGSHNSDDIALPSFVYDPNWYFEKYTQLFYERTALNERLV